MKAKIQFSLQTMSRAVALLVICALFVNALNERTQGDSGKLKQKADGAVKASKDDCLKIGNKLGCACPVCRDVVQFTRVMILDHVPTVEQVLDKVCRRIFKDDQHKESLCEDIVKSELPEIIKYVKARIDPRKVCAKFC